MQLSERITELRDASLSALDDTHDFFAHTKALWRLAQVESKRGKRFTFRNRVTGTTVTHEDLPTLAQKYVTQYMASATLQQLISRFEEFVFAFLREYYCAFPRSLSAKELTLQAVLDHPSTSDVVLTVVERHLRELAYEGLQDWFAAVERIAAIGCPDSATIDRLKEAKASRDVLVHNNGIANPLYVDRSGLAARFKPGEALDVSEGYLRETHERLRDTINNMADAAIAKLSKRTKPKTRESP